MIRYFQGSKHKGFHLQKLTLDLHAFFQMLFGLLTLKTSAVLLVTVFTGKNPILGIAKKQNGVVKSSIEAKYKAFAFTTMDLAQSRVILEALSIQLSSSPNLYCDNVLAIDILLLTFICLRESSMQGDCNSDCVIRTSSY